MPFQSFGGFAFARGMRTEQLTVTYPTGDSKQRDALGQPIKSEPTVKHICETIVNNSNPNLTFTSTDGGQYGVGTLYWESSLLDVPEHAIVERENGDQYQVTAMADDVFAGLKYYALKRIEVKHT